MELKGRYVDRIPPCDRVVVFLERKKFQNFDALNSLQIFRGNQADNSEKFGCSAMILFSDPADVAAEGTDPEDVYPNTFWLPPTGMQVTTIVVKQLDSVESYEMNHLNESLSMNLFRMWGMTFIPNNETRHTRRK
jgi:hypothetical protein